MAYIGRTPTVGNFQICDAISVVNNQAAYTMQVGSVNVIPQSANHMIVSLNGVIQKPNSSFTVSGSTITFSSNLATGDVIDFIQILGDVLDLGVPSDATVTDAKTNFVSTSSAAGLQIKGDGTTDGTLQLNCSQNSHGIKLKSPPHSASASYTLTFPNNDGDANQVLTTNGSGVLSFAAAGGITVADQWRITANKSLNNTANVYDANLEQVDGTGQGTLGSAMSVSSGVFTYPSTGTYLVMSNTTFQSTNTQVSKYVFTLHQNCTNGSSFVTSVEPYGYYLSSSEARYMTITGIDLVNVSNTSNVKTRFLGRSEGTVNALGSSSFNYTCFTFIRLGDST